MLNDIATAFDRARGTLVQDAIGAMSLAVILLGALHLPGLI
ncbi:hypothetical protein [Aestuariicoccus sp. MJ-SS9]|nr:hypothetical protein [Aestuariicoccus sp. MJ-SS9]MDU8911562.1 hypothetical protein [Aestuariicoccus sp. MJ-SS9]